MVLGIEDPWIWGVYVLIILCEVIMQRMCTVLDGMMTW